jgi:hypothetical protein
MKVVAQVPLPSVNSDERIELVCASGHRTTHSLARVLRLNDGWCGKCGADIRYEQAADTAPVGRRSL